MPRKHKRKESTNCFDALAAAVEMQNEEPNVEAWRNELDGGVGVATKAPLSVRRDEECRVYDGLYTNSAYRMGEARRRDVNKLLARLAVSSGAGSLLDVGTGRGETIVLARQHGFDQVQGTEAAETLLNDDVLYAQAHDLPFEDNSFDHVTCFDVLEHLLPEDVNDAIREMWRVARKTVTFSAACRPSHFGGPNARDLHISARPIEAWNATVVHAIGYVTQPCGNVGGTPVWRLVKDVD